MAVHAGFSWRNACEFGSLDGGMAVAAINSQAGNVVLMAEGRGLRLDYCRVGDIRRTLDLGHGPEHKRHHKHRPINARSGNRVCTAMKDLHCRSMQAMTLRSSQVHAALRERPSQDIVTAITETSDYNSSGILRVRAGLLFES